MGAKNRSIVFSKGPRIGCVGRPNRESETMGLRTAARAALGSVLCVFVALASANGQNAPSNLKEVQLADGTFSLGDPIPPWVETVAIPEVGEIKPIIVRLADTQWLVGDTPVVHIHRAVMVN
ncbi:MAG: hypothetical protein WB764_25020, partial [Xanthobacteraceae bacterium]